MLKAKTILGAVRRAIADRRGTSAIELALCMPVIVGMIIPMADLGMGAYLQMQVQNAAQAGAEYAGRSGFNVSGIETAAQAATGLGNGITFPSAPSQSCSCISGTNVVAATPASGPPCTQSCGSGSVGTYVTVSTQYLYTTLFPYPALPSPVTLTAQATIRIK